LIDVATNIDIVNKSGAWYSYGDIRLGQGRENAKDYIKSHPELYTEIEDKVYDKLNLKRSLKEKESE
jgi:recombination protein RecA